MNYICLAFALQSTTDHGLNPKANNRMLRQAGVVQCCRFCPDARICVDHISIDSKVTVPLVGTAIASCAGAILQK